MFNKMLVSDFFVLNKRQYNTSCRELGDRSFAVYRHVPKHSCFLEENACSYTSVFLVGKFNAQQSVSLAPEYFQHAD